MRVSKAPVLNLDGYRKQGTITNDYIDRIALYENETTHEKIAVKTFSSNLVEESEKTMFYREVDILFSLKHGCIVPFIGYIPLGDDDYNPQIATKYMANGSLADIINSIKRHRPPQWWTPTAKTIAIYGTLVGMSFMHSNNVIHRDLKPESIFFDENYEPKIGDFGVSKFYNPEQEMTQTIFDTGNPQCIAPEFFEGLCFSNKADLYSFSMVLYYILFNHEPYPSCKSKISIMSIIARQIKPEIPNSSSRSDEDEIPPELIEIMKSCWNINPMERPTFEEILKFLYENKIVLPGTDIEKFNSYMNKFPTTRTRSVTAILPPSDKKKRVDNNLSHSAINDNTSNNNNSNINNNNDNNNLMNDNHHKNSYVDGKLKSNMVQKNSIFKIDEIPVISIGRSNDDNKKNKGARLYSTAINIYNGNGISRDEATAISLFDKSAKKKCIEAQFWLAEYYSKGSQHYDEEKYQKYHKMAVLSGHPEALYNAALQLLKAKPIKKEKINKIIKYLTESSEKGNKKSSYKLARIYDKGPLLPGRTRDVSKAIELYKKAADLGHMKAQYYYGLCMNEKGDYVNASKYLRFAAQQGHVQATYQVALLFSIGAGCPQSDVNAAKFMKWAAEKNCKEAMIAFASFLMTGTGVQKNEEAAQRLFLMAES